MGDMSPTVHPILFTGSSIVALWESLPASLRGTPILNTAVSGSQTADILARLDGLVIRHQPRMVCYYCGSNDINASVPPEQIVEQVHETFIQLRQSIPDLRFVYLSIIKAPQKRDRWDQVDFVNGCLLQMPGLEFIDINPVFFTPGGEPRLDFYVEDLLHHTPQAYLALNEYVLPRLADEPRYA
jgi:lysophospholipase L1-like esterase